VAQDTIELSTYLALSGTQVGLIPDHYAQRWVEKEKLVQVAPSDYAIVSQFHALRLRSANPEDVADRAWRQIKTSGQDYC
jgi:DNA-binding transcriptional LysR family regulator